ncbi:MAG: YigZ family protein [Ruminococcus sp.]|jgi:uncharacterized YigZ family protein
MIERYRTIYKGAAAEITEKKSRFIATLKYVENEEEALAFIESMKKQYWNATHNCWAYVLGQRQEIVRCSDDGEPQGTAGKPMLDVLTGAGICYGAAVVTRYFGGTLLGTGGLVRAYGKAVQEGLKECVTVERQYGIKLEIQTDYNGLGKIQYLLGQRKIPVLEAQYEADVKMKILLPFGQFREMEADITEATNGKAVMKKQEELYFALLDGQILTGSAMVCDD